MPIKGILLVGCIVLVTGTALGNEDVETPSAATQPDTGYYLRLTDERVFFYEATTEALVETADEADPASSTDQDGYCTYTGPWEDSESEFVFGQCISFAHDASVGQIRFDVRDLGESALQLRLMWSHLDSNQSAVEESTVLKVNCPTGLPVRSCEYARDLDVPAPAEGAVILCGHARVHTVSNDGTLSAEPKWAVSPTCLDV